MPCPSSQSSRARPGEAYHISSQQQKTIKVVLGLRYTSVVELLRFVLLNTKALGSPYNHSACNSALKVTSIAPRTRACQALGILKGDLDGQGQSRYSKSAQMLKVSTSCSSSLLPVSCGSCTSFLLSHNRSRCFRNKSLLWLLQWHLWQLNLPHPRPAALRLLRQKSRAVTLTARTNCSVLTLTTRNGS